MKFYMKRADLGSEPVYKVPGFTLCKIEEDDLSGNWYVTTYVYEHDATETRCMVKMHWNEDTGSDPEDFVVGRCFEKDGEELAHAQFIVDNENGGQGSPVPFPADGSWSCVRFL